MEPGGRETIEGSQMWDPKVTLRLARLSSDGKGSFDEWEGNGQAVLEEVVTRR